TLSFGRRVAVDPPGGDCYSSALPSFGQPAAECRVLAPPRIVSFYGGSVQPDRSTARSLSPAPAQRLARSPPPFFSSSPLGGAHHSSLVQCLDPACPPRSEPSIGSPSIRPPQLFATTGPVSVGGGPNL